MTEKLKIRDCLKVYFIAGTLNCEKPLKEVLKEALTAGITMFQFREKGKGSLQGAAKEKLAAELFEMCKENGVPFIVNDDLELAVKIGADGLHIGQEDAAAITAKNEMKNKWLGVSVHTVEEAKKAIEDGADYLGIGPIFPTDSKDDAKAVQGTSLIENLRKIGISFPIVGIGGINEHNAGTVIEAGADGVSVISAISKAPDIRQSVKQLKREILNNKG
ncbi:thiamine phosphate synthase [Metabacillus sp. RGM 3146]|uniref:thiamine phosphate synthase n=1 Tax=Metabacillus sp. RGM 3146 TaxID=3401092 RepID=UPI003B9B42E5